MKLSFRRKKLTQTNQQEGELIKLSLEEQETINGGGWLSQAYCDAYNGNIEMGSATGFYNPGFS